MQEDLRGSRTLRPPPFPYARVPPKLASVGGFPYDLTYAAAFTMSAPITSNLQPKTSIGIIGYGSFGQFVHELARHYVPEAHVVVYARSRPEDELFRPLAEVAAAHVVIVCVPIRAYEAVLNDLLPLVGPSTLVVDVATVKKYTVELLRKHGGLRYLALHPMFGPYSYLKKGRSLEGLRLVLAEDTLTEKERTVFDQLVQKTGLSLVRVGADEHDKALAETLFLTHYVAQVVAKGGFERTDIDTVSFGFLMDAVESVRNDTELFKDVYEWNPYCREVVERFDRAEREVHDLLGAITTE